MPSFRLQFLPHRWLILIQGNPVSYVGIQTILCIQFPLFNPVQEEK